MAALLSVLLVEARLLSVLLVEARLLSGSYLAASSPGDVARIVAPLCSMAALLSVLLRRTHRRTARVGGCLPAQTAAPMTSSDP